MELFNTFLEILLVCGSTLAIVYTFTAVIKMLAGMMDVERNQYERNKDEY